MMSTSFKLFGLLSTLVGTGINVKDAINIILRSANPYAEYHLKSMRDMTKIGVYGLLQLETGLLPHRLRLRLRIASASGINKECDILSIVANDSFDDFKQGLEQPTQYLTLLLYVIFGCLLLSAVYVMLICSFSISSMGKI